MKHRDKIERREASFVDHFRTWISSPHRKVPKEHRDHIQTIYNAHMLHANTDPFKLALYKLMGKLEPQKRNVAKATTTTEDWLWFQLSMIDEEQDGGLRALSEVLLGYGERQFDGPPNEPNSRRGVWAGVLLMCGQFERVRSHAELTDSHADVRLGCCSAVGTSRHRSGSRSFGHWFGVSRLAASTIKSRNL